MKKTLLIALCALGFSASAQVSNPEVTYNLLSRTGWAATASSEATGEAAPSGPASAALDDNTSTFWSSTWGQAYPHTVTIDMLADKTIEGVYIVQRNATYSKIRDFSIETSNDGTNWTSQLSNLIGENNTAKQYFKFNAPAIVRYYRLTITKTYGKYNFENSLPGSYDDPTAALAETGAFTTTTDSKKWNRKDWVITATDKNGNADSYASQPTALLKDNDNGTWWEADWNKGTGYFPRTLKFDFTTPLQINKFTYVQRNHTNSRIKTATLSYSNDDITYVDIPVTWAANSNVNNIIPSSRINARYVKIVIAESVGDASSVALAEFSAFLDSTLPVELTSFTAKTNGSTVNLNWTTVSEQNASHFNITRSTDGTNFNTIGKLAAAGNSSSAKKYNFTDFTPANGINYYQLQQIDLDGTVAKFDVKQANVSLTNTELAVVSTTASTVTVTVKGSDAKTGTITITNTLGQKIASQNINLANGASTATINTNNAKGLLIVTLNTATQSLSKKIIK